MFVPLWHKIVRRMVCAIKLNGLTSFVLLGSELLELTIPPPPPCTIREMMSYEKKYQSLALSKAAKAPTYTGHEYSSICEVVVSERSS